MNLYLFGGFCIFQSRGKSRQSGQQLIGHFRATQ
ncbi:Uncharacterised protein [Vibrio cholerae]|nr:Uncharacterised protein [Vibrio cholerae]